MPCGCGQSFCPECMEGYVPTPPPEPGTPRWKDDQAFHYALDVYNGLPERSVVLKLPADWGYFAIEYHPNRGWSYFRVDSIEEKKP